ncbi:MAG: polyphosphate polymerase domain-containing protein [Bacillota bacterium]
MKKNPKFRHELKYEINYGQYLALQKRIQPIMSLDQYAQDSGCYQIKSIYFDTPNDKALKEKLYGLQKHEKFRIRYYNDDLTHISLEKKLKYNSLCTKLGTVLSEQECRNLLEGRTDWMLNHSQPLVKELYCRMKNQVLRPKVMVSYRREPYVYPAGNVRVTFDSQIRSSMLRQNFLDRAADIDTADNTGHMLLEIKYDNYLPEIISDIVQTEGIRQQAFSKYAAARKFG